MSKHIAKQRQGRSVAIAIFFTLLSVLGWAPSASAGYSHVNGKVTRLELFSDTWTTYDTSYVGMLGIWVQGVPSACGGGSGSGRIVITSDHPNYDAVLSALLVAKTTDTNVRIYYLDTCNLRSNSWDFGYLDLP